MTRDDIIRMAREANILEPIDFLESNQWLPDTIRELERFAALVISHHNKTNRPKPDASEREWLQQIAYQHGGIGDLCQTEFEFGAMVAAAERNAILQMSREQWFKTQADFEEAIKARGEHK